MVIQYGEREKRRKNWQETTSKSQAFDVAVLKIIIRLFCVCGDVVVLKIIIQCLFFWCLLFPFCLSLLVCVFCLFVLFCYFLVFNKLCHFYGSSVHLFSMDVCVFRTNP